MKSLLYWMLLPAAGLLSGAAARGTGDVYQVNGVVREALDAKGELRIAHEDIPGLMPAMTMAFRVADPAEAAGVRAGDRVRFALHAAGSDWFISSLFVTGHDEVAATNAVTKARITRLREGDPVPAFALEDQDGTPLTNASLRGRATVMTFIFTRCPVPEFCPAMAARFGALQAAVKAEPALAALASLLSITLDPAFDEPVVLKAYGAAVGADFGVWRFATGTEAQIAALTKAFAVYTERNGVTLDHTLCTALIGPDGTVREIWRGSGWANDEVIAALRAALRE
jgi:protein SCO1/2